MEVTIKIDFKELTKSVSAETKIEVVSEITDLTELAILKEEVLKESRQLFDSAMDYSRLKTQQKQ